MTTHLSIGIQRRIRATVDDREIIIGRGKVQLRQKTKKFWDQFDIFARIKLSCQKAAIFQENYALHGQRHTFTIFRQGYFLTLSCEKFVKPNNQ